MKTALIAYFFTLFIFKAGLFLFQKNKLHLVS